MGQRMISLIEEVQQNTNVLAANINAAQDSWDDCNYENIAQKTSSELQASMSHYYAIAATEVQVINQEIIEIESIISRNLKCI
jgi:hypothetical protein